MKQAPLHGIKVVDLGHTVMGPSAGMILADLGATVIKVEPAAKGDPTRHLKGFGIGYFGYFNRNKQSIAIDLKSPEGLEVARRLIGEDIQLDSLLKACSLVSSGGEAKILITDGRVQVDGRDELRRSAKIRAGQAVSLQGARIKLVAEGTAAPAVDQENPDTGD